MFKIQSILPPIAPIKIIDVGAMAIAGDQDAYARLAEVAPVEIVGFEPVEAELAKLRAAHPKGRTYLPYAIGDGGRHTFHETNFPMTSSLFEPNIELIGKFQALGELMQVVSRTEVDTKRLDDIPEVVGTDYLKLDVQGAELMILKGGEKLLEEVVLIHAEVEFAELYKGQPLFADIDTYLRSRGFVLHRFNGMAGRAFKPFLKDGNPHAPLSQTLWGDAVFIKDFMHFDRLPTEKLMKLAVILHETYQSLDLVAVVLDAIDKREQSQLQAAYFQQFSRPNG